MPSFIRVTDQKFYAQLNNGNSFSLNPSDFSRELKGGVTEKLRAEFDVEVTWYTELNSFSVYTNNAAGFIRVEFNGNDFFNDGFSVGDQVKISLPSAGAPPNTYYTGDIQSITDGEVEIINAVLQAGTAFTDGYVSNLSNGFLTGLTPLTALKYKFGLIENDEPINFLSKLTNTEQIILIDGIDHGSPLTFSDGVSFGNNKAWVTGTASCAYVGTNLDKDRNVPQLTGQTFRIRHDFVINPLYRDGELDSLIGTDQPPSDIYKGNRSLKYVFNTEFRTTLNSPNTSKNANYDTQKGSVGYLGESCNGYANNYSIGSLSYINVTDGSIPADRIQIDKTTRVSFNLLSDSALLTNTTPFVVGHSAILDSLEYTNSTDNYQDLWLHETVRQVTGLGATSGTIIKNVTAINNTSQSTSIVFDVEFTSDAQKQIENGQDYALFLTVQDEAKTVDTGNKATIRIDVNTYEKSPDIAGLYEVEKLEQYPHPLDFELGVSEGFTSGKMFVEDGQMLYARLKVLNTYLGDDLTLTEDVTLENLTFKLVVFDTVNNTWFNLRELEIDLSDQVVSGNIQNIELDSTRGYILTDTDIFNSLKLSTDTNDGTWQYYDLQVGYKIPWQTWLEAIDADPIFYDKSLSLNGLNQNASRYMSNPDYKIRLLIDANVETIGVTTNYVKSSGDFTVYNYETDDQDPDAYSCEINTYNSDGVVLENNIIKKEFTEVRAKITPIVPPTFTQSVDFTKVSTDWTRYAHGNKLTIGSVPRLGDWTNQQANDTDTFTDRVTTFTKNDPLLYTSTANQILADQNCNAIYGCVSLLEYEFYSITGKMFSNEPDDDVIAYTLAFLTDEDGVEHTLSLCVTTGGLLLDLNPSYTPGSTTTSVFTFGSGFCEWALVYDYGKDTCKQLDFYQTTKNGFQWNNAAVGDVTFSVSRAANDFTIDVSWPVDGTTFTNTFNYNINDDVDTEKFMGLQRIAFTFLSQNQGGFKDVELTLPDSYYYGILRIETNDSPTDNAISELSTIIEAPENSLLKQITGTSRLATLSYDGNSFYIQGLVETSLINEGDDYKFSGLLRLKDLEV